MSVPDPQITYVCDGSSDGLVRRWEWEGRTPYSEPRTERMIMAKAEITTLSDKIYVRALGAFR